MFLVEKKYENPLPIIFSQKMKLKKTKKIFYQSKKEQKNKRTKEITCKEIS
jgi:hypothetical protein